MHSDKHIGYPNPTSPSPIYLADGHSLHHPYLFVTGMFLHLRCRAYTYRPFFRTYYLQHVHLDLRVSSADLDPTYGLTYATIRLKGTFVGLLDITRNAV